MLGWRRALRKIAVIGFGAASWDQPRLGFYRVCISQSTWLGMSRKRLGDVVRCAEWRLASALYGALVTALRTILPLPSEELKVRRVQ